jgi:3-oxoacyl-[acyl-carrier protein] reductase
MDLQLTRQRVLITGASKGIGLACANAFAAEGAELILVARDAARLDSAAASILGARAVHTFACDLSRPAERERLAACFPQVDVLVNNAGAIPPGSVLDIGIDDWAESWSLKVMGYIHLTQLYLREMKARRAGTIVNIIGIGGAAPRFDYACGASGNAALMAFTQAVGGRSPDFGVRVLALNPAPTLTDRLVKLYEAYATQRWGDASRWREFLDGLPFGRAADPAEIGAITAMMASPRASYVSGTVIDIDAGTRFR